MPAVAKETRHFATPFPVPRSQTAFTSFPDQASVNADRIPIRIKNDIAAHPFERERRDEKRKTVSVTVFHAVASREEEEVRVGTRVRDSVGPPLYIVC